MPEVTAVNMPEMMPASPSQPSALAMFPRWLQEIMVDAVLTAQCERTTDIWYEHDAGKCVVVLRNGIQWYLNETATAMWMRKDVPVREFIREWAADASAEKKREIATQVVDFLLLAVANGLVTLVPEGASAAKQETAAAQKAKKA